MKNLINTIVLLSLGTMIYSVDTEEQDTTLTKTPKLEVTSAFYCEPVAPSSLPEKATVEKTKPVTPPSMEVQVRQQPKPLIVSSGSSGGSTGKPIVTSTIVHNPPTSSTGGSVGIPIQPNLNSHIAPSINTISTVSYRPTTSYQTPARQKYVVRLARRGPWTYPGNILNHLRREHPNADLSGLSHSQLVMVHDNFHETGQSGIRYTNPSPVVSQPIITSQPTITYAPPVQRFNSNNCPGGVCPTPSSGMRWGR